jgi:hypothetical protein
MGIQFVFHVFIILLLSTTSTSDEPLAITLLPFSKSNFSPLVLILENQQGGSQMDEPLLTFLASLFIYLFAFLFYLCAFGPIF